MKIDLSILKTYVDERWISMQKHPSEPLLIWNYTQNTQFANKWDGNTTICRGLITDLDGHVVARPFPKFFNLGQGDGNQIEDLPAEVPVVTEKLDGSLGILYWASSGPAIATRGSFTSDQAQWATDWLSEWDYREGEFKPGYTYCFEILYTKNRIVVDYRGKRDEGLVLLAVIKAEDGSEIDHVAEARRLGFMYAEVINDDLGKLIELCKTMTADQEGFVLRYSNGLRVKMKGDEYVRLHRIVTQCSARRVWECLSTGTPLEVWLERVPDELFQWARDTERRLVTEFNGIFVSAQLAFRSVQDMSTRKEQALYLREHHPGVMDLAFALLDGKPVDAAIWKRIRPAHELPYKVAVE